MKTIHPAGSFRVFVFTRDTSTAGYPLEILRLYGFILFSGCASLF
jgi:hypothetical protein